MVGEERAEYQQRPIKSFRDLRVFRESYELALEIQEASKSFPREELYSLSDQIRRAARSVPANIAEGWAKREYELVFKRHLWDAHGSIHEVSVWLDFARDHGYLSADSAAEFAKRAERIGGMLHQLLRRWKTIA